MVDMGQTGITHNTAFEQSDMPSLVAAAHELKSPLVLLRQMSLELDETDDPQRRKVLSERLRFTADQGLRLVEQLTLSSRLQDSLFETEPLQVQAVFQDLESQLRPLASHLGIDVSIKTPQRPLVTVANRDLLPALLRNFCDNALAYTPREGRIQLIAAQRRGQIYLGVRDEGPVISPQSFRQLRERMGRQPQPLSARPRSSGLGLWIAGLYAEAMSASLVTERHRHGGMTFGVMLAPSEQLSLL